MSSQQVCIFGVGQTGRIVASILEDRADDDVEIVGFVDDDPTTHGADFEGYPVLGDRSALGSLQIDAVCVGVGRVEPRRSIAEFLVGEGIPLASAVHPSVIVPRRSHIGLGSVVGPGTVFFVNSQLGLATYVGPQVVVSHDTVVGDFSLLSVGATVGARVDVGTAAFIGSGAVVMPPAWGVDARLLIGDGATVGAGAVVIGDVEPGDTVVGVPARSTKKHR